MKPTLQIVEALHFSLPAKQRLETEFTVNVWPTPIESTDVLWCRFKKPDLSQYPNLKLLCANCTDVSHLPLEECQRRGIEVLSLKGIKGLDTVHATAEHTISLMLQALRQLCDRSGGRIGRELRGKKVCIVGWGRIGKQVERLCRCFGCRPVGIEQSWEKESLAHEFLASADIVSIHASVNETSKGMVNAEFLAKLKPGCILVNTARHAIVEEYAVLGWLNRDKAAIYAHDFSDEWKPFRQEFSDSAYEPHQQVIGTPHIGGWTLESLHKTEELLAERVIEWAKSKMEVAV